MRHQCPLATLHCAAPCHAAPQVSRLQREVEHQVLSRGELSDRVLRLEQQLQSSRAGAGPGSSIAQAEVMSRR